MTVHLGEEGRRMQTARLELRTTEEQKRLIERAAELQGRTVADFVVSTAYESAKRVIQEHETLVLSARDREVFVSALLNPPTLRGPLAKAAERYKTALAR
jgi:uncharacterized protein (DUF1778 family)